MYLMEVNLEVHTHTHTHPVDRSHTKYVVRSFLFTNVKMAES